MEKGSSRLNLQRFQGMVPRSCTVKCTSTTLVKNWKRATHDNKSTLACVSKNIAIDKTLSKRCREGLLKEAVGISEVADHGDIGVDPSTYVSLLEEFANKRAFSEGKQVHAHALKSGYQCNGGIGNKLIVMYIKCGNLEDARQVFDKMSKRNAFLWSMVVGAYARRGLWEDVLDLLHWMQGEGIRADNIVLPSVLKACAGLTALEQGKEVHGYIVRNGFELDIVVETALVDMYAKCGCLVYACQIFDKMTEKDVVSWTAIIGGFAQIGDGEEVLRLHSEMELSGVKPDAITWNVMTDGFAQNGQGDEVLVLDPSCYASLLQAFANKRALAEGKQVHAHVLKSGYEGNGSIGNELVVMYIKCGNVEDARQVFDKMSRRNAFLWSMVVRAYARCRLWEDVFNLLHWMQGEGIRADNIIIPSVLKACAGLTALEQGKEVHGYIIRNGFELDVVVENALVDMYAKCGCLVYACQVFDKMTEKNAVSWTAMIAGFAQIGDSEEVLRLHCEMELSGVKPNASTWNVMMAGFAQNGQGDEALGLDPSCYASLLQAFANKRALAEGKQVHAHVLKSGYEGNGWIGNKLVVMYTKCGNLEDARQVFDKMSRRNAFLWSMVVGAYARCRLWEDVFNLLDWMQGEGIKADNFVIPSVLKACAGLTALERGKEVHGYIVRNGFELDIVVENALVDMYTKCGYLVYACQVFDKMTEKDVVSWTAIIGGFAQNGYIEEALEAFCQMQLENVKPNSVTISGVLSACADLGALWWGIQIHGYVIKSGFEFNVSIGSALVDMYSKCMNIDDACKVFDQIPEKNAFLWNAMIGGYAQNGHADQLLELLHEMNLTGMKPDVITWNTLFAGFAEKGQGYKALDLFHEMNLTDMKPDVITWNTLITNFAKKGECYKALELFHEMNLTGMNPDVITWNALIIGFAKTGEGYKALELLFQMHLTDLKPNVILWKSLIAGFVQSGHAEEALKLFHRMLLGCITPDLDSWNAVIARCSQDGHNEEALKQFPGMKMAPIKPDPFTIASVLSACASLMALQHGKEVHCYLLRNGFESNVFVGSSLVNMYAKCKSVEAARRVFDMLSHRNVVSWKVMIAGYTQNRHSDDALKLFRQMQEAGLKPDSATIATVLSVSSNLMALREGKQVHCYITRHAMDADVVVRSALVEMYAKCGSIADARCVFDQTYQRDVPVWNAVIAGYAIHGLCEDALTLFHQMQQSGIKADHITFTTILSVCSHSGMVSEGWKYFNSMTQDYGLKPSKEDYTCMVKLLGDAGNLDNNHELISSIPFKPDA